MKEDDFEKLVRRLEVDATISPRAFRTRVALISVAAYLVLFGLMAALATYLYLCWTFFQGHAWALIKLGAIGLAVASPILGPLFTGDADVRQRLIGVLLVAALGQPLAGVVFVLDGVLIGAGDGRYLAWGGVVVLAVYAPVALAAVWLGGGLLTVWLAFSLVFLGARFVVLTSRARGERWLVTGAARVA